MGGEKKIYKKSERVEKRRYGGSPESSLPYVGKKEPRRIFECVKEEGQNGNRKLGTHRPSFFSKGDTR